MSLLDLSVRPNGPVEIVNGAVRLRCACIDDYADWTILRAQSRQHLTWWEPDWSDAETTQKAFRQRIRAQNRHMRRRTALPLLVFLKGEATLVGGVTLSQIRLGASQSAMLGFWVGVAYTRRGYAAAAVNGVLGHAFEQLGLNRVEAACQPGNQASRRLLESCGFQREGVARDYLKINGVWRDHLLFATVSRDYSAGARNTGLSSLD